MPETIRPAAVAGRFYPQSAQALRLDLEVRLKPSPKKQAHAIMVPHAGYHFSGDVAARVFEGVHIPDRCIIMSPNHTGKGHRLAVAAYEAFETPLGKVEVDKEGAERIVDAVGCAELDKQAHENEHGIEVLLPFIQYAAPQTCVVPIVVGRLSPSEMEELGGALRSESERGDCLVIVSSDMNHFESDEISRRKDDRALKALKSMRARELLECVEVHDISMCGVMPAAAYLHSVEQQEKRISADVIAYSNSGEVNGDLDSVVGYAGVMFMHDSDAGA